VRRALLLPLCLLTASFAPPAARAQATPRNIHSLVDEPLVLDHRASTAERKSVTVVSINTGESAVLSTTGDVPDEDSLAAAKRIMRDHDGRHEREISPALVTLLVRIGQHTGGPLELVSGYRHPQHPWDKNFHNKAMAADIRAKGMTTVALRKLARDLKVPGIGYYPVSKMIHVDVRDVPYAWTDWSRP
jgi:uncharacterized protein YcbK (DUF882 family)